MPATVEELRNLLVIQAEDVVDAINRRSTPGAGADTDLLEEPADQGDTRVSQVARIRQIDQINEVVETTEYLRYLTEAGALELSALFNLYEQLLSDGASLLERAREARAGYENLAEKAFASWLELAQAVDLEAIQHERLIDDGGIKLPSAEASAELSRIELVIAGLQAQEDNLAELEKGAREGRLAGDGLGTDYLTYAGWNTYLGLRPSSKIITGIMPGGRFNDNEAMVLGQRVAEDIARFDLRYRLFEILERGASVSAAKNSLMEMQRYQITKKDFYNNDVARREREMFVSAGAILRRSIEVASGTQAYLPRLREGLIAYQLAVREAATRLKTAKEGMERLAGMALPSIPAGGLDELTIWTRLAKEMINRFNYGDEIFLIRVPVAQRTGVTIKDGLQAENWSLKLTGEDFYENRRVRFRGVSAAYEGSEQDGSIPIELKLPSPGLSYPVADGVAEVVIQSNASQLRLGDVRHIRSPLPREIASPPSWFNLSPIASTDNDSVLQVIIPPFDGRERIEERVSEIVLYLHVVARPKKAA